MAGERPRLALVDRALAEQPEAPGRADAVRAVLAKHAPTISRLVRADVTAELLRKVGAATLEEISSLPHLRASFEREEAKHVKAGEWRGVAKGIVVGLLVSVCFMWAWSFVSSEHDSRMVVTGAGIAANPARQPMVCTPGERMPDGHTCGLPGRP